MARPVTISVAKGNDAAFRLAAAIAQETNDSLSAVIAVALKRWIRYMEQTRPGAVERARAKCGVQT